VARTAEVLQLQGAAVPQPGLHPVKAAALARLRYVTDQRPGIRRLRSGKGFRYVGPRGQTVHDSAVLDRIRTLAIPPAWTDVWICPEPRGHVQATGRDARGRKQYRYHPDWRTTRDETKFHRMEAFARALPALRRRVSIDLARPGLPRPKVLAAVVQLLERSLIRIGNEEYARENQSFGLTTLRDRHVQVRGDTLRFQFRGKSGKHHTINVNDRRLARVVKQCRDLPGQELFQYVDEDGRRQRIGSGDINGYVRDATGQEFTTKDFRTWWGSVLAVAALRELQPPRTKTQAEKNVVLALDAVAALLGNTRAVCRRSYVHPGVIDCYIQGLLTEGVAPRPTETARPAAGLRADELALLAVLKRLRRVATARRSDSTDESRQGTKLDGRPLFLPQPSRT
jgi:DNA topoisomerase-1